VIIGQFHLCNVISRQYGFTLAMNRPLPFVSSPMEREETNDIR